MTQSPRSNPGQAALSRAVRRLRARVGGAPATPGAAGPASDPAFTRAHWRLGRTVLGEDAMPPTWTELEFRRDRVDAMVSTVRRARGYAALGEQLALGRSPARARAATVRALCADGFHDDARAFALGSEALGAADPVDRLCWGLVLAYASGRLDLAWPELATADDALLAEAAPVEAVAAALRVGTEESVGRAVAVARLAAADPRTGADDLVELAGRLLVTGHEDDARALAALAEERSGELSGTGEQLVENLRRWTHPAEPSAVPAGAVSVGVIDYHQPDLDRASRNVGDYVQTLAMLGNLARFRGVRFGGDDGLGEAVTEVQARIRPELHLPGGDRDVHLVPVSRDFSAGDPIPPDTWAVAFGWHLHSTFEVGHGLPYHPNLNPLFVSFHVNKTEILDEPTLAYLRERGPVGCRDWATVDLLLSAGVDAFFTGCLTTTVGAAFADRGPDDGSRVVGVVDLPESQRRHVEGPVEVLRHGGLQFRSAGLAEGVRAAVSLLEGYQQRFSRVVTSRLHSYLPATALDLDVEFLPARIGDVRFDGLLGMHPGAPEFVRMRDGIRDLLADVWSLILAGEDREAVYSHWRSTTGPLVEEARRRHVAPPRIALPSVDVAAIVTRVREDQRRHGPHDSLRGPDGVTDVATSVDAATAALLPVTVESLLAHATGPVRLWATARGIGPAYEAWFADAFPELAVTFLGCDRVDRGPDGRKTPRPARRHGVATTDRLLLPELLPDVRRLVCLDVGTVVLADVRELAGTDLAGHPLAARPSHSPGSSVWRRVGNHLSAELASDLRRTMSARHAFDFTALDGGVAVWDLERLRADGLAAAVLPWARAYRLDDQDALNAWVGPARADLEARWNLRPSVDRVDPATAGIVHFADGLEPWSSPLAPRGALWHEYAGRVRDRAGDAPR